MKKMLYGAKCYVKGFVCASTAITIISLLFVCYHLANENDDLKKRISKDYCRKPASYKNIHIPYGKSDMKNDTTLENPIGFC